LAADEVEQDSPLPATASVVAAKRPAAIIVIVRKFIMSSYVELRCVDF
jgi:hypothetical protein